MAILPFLALTLAFQGDNVPPKMTVTLDKAPASAAAPRTGSISITFAPGMHGYQNPPSEDYQIAIKLSASPNVKVLSLVYPKGVPAKVGGEDKPSMVYEGTIKVPVKFKILKPGPISFTLDYQQCNEAACFPPASVTAKITLAGPAKKGAKP